MKDSRAKAPGKLYIAGEYAVTVPGYPAVVVAVNRFITVSLTVNKDTSGTLVSPALFKEPLRWQRSDKGPVLLTEQPKAAILLASIAIAETFITSHGKPLPYYTLTVESELTDESGTKYGLGSSGAVTVATIRAILQSASLNVTDEVVYKLAALSHLSLESRGSFGDLAAAAYTGWIHYSRFDKEWVLSQSKNLSLQTLVSQEWPLLKIEPIEPPEAINLLIGWTASPASTENLIQSMNHSSQENQQDAYPYERFLDESKHCVEQLVKGIRSNNASLIYEQIRLNRQLLLKMSQMKNMIVETPKLKHLIETAERFGAAAKTSGAGGGDCGIALITESVNQQALVDEWHAKGILQLPLTVFTK